MHNTKFEEKHDERVKFDAHPFGKVVGVSKSPQTSPHVSPTSSVRMLYRQKVWNKSEPKVDWRRVRLSTKSNCATSTMFDDRTKYSFKLK